MDAFFKAFGVFVEQPLLAFIPAAIFAVLYFLNRRLMVAVAAGCWAVYAILEVLNKARITCSGECNIRVDLLVIYPVLALVSAVALAVFFIPRKSASDETA